MTPDQERDYLLDHVRHPRHSGELADATHVGECRNPACGDHVKVWLKKDSDGGMVIKMKASGCTICIATASLMADLVFRKTHSEMKALVQLMQASMRSPGSEWPLALESLQPLKRMRESPMKIPCTLVSWVALEKALGENLNA